MTQERTARSILVVDTDVSLLQSSQNNERAKQFPLLICASARIAQLQIAERNHAICGVFVNPAISTEGCISVIRSAHQHRPVMPVYLVLENGAPEFLDETRRRQLGIRGTVEKPFEFQTLIDKVAPLTLSFDPKSMIGKAASHDLAAGAEVSGEDANFVPIRALDFVSGSQSFFDVFVRLTSGKYIKLLKAGDSFTPDRLEKYLKSGVEFFYLPKEIHEGYLRYCDQIASVFLGNAKVAREVKTKQVLNHGDQTLKFLKSQGLNESNLRYARKFVANVRELVQGMKAGSDAKIESFLGNVAAYDHGVSVSMLACILANSLEISMDRPVQIVGMAAMFHDFGLYLLPEELWDEDETKLNPAQLKAYRTHPEKGAEALRRLSGFDPAALQAIEQHHMCLGEGGFPPKKGQLSRVSEIVGITNQFDRYIRAHRGAPPKDLLDALTRGVFPKYSKQIVYAFRSAFFPKH